MHESVMAFGQAVLNSSDISGKRVVEVGSMNINGSLREHIEALGPASYVGVDFLAGAGVDVVCDAGELVTRFGEGAFDVVVSTEMLEHAQNWRSAIDAMKRVLVPGGVLLLTARGPGFKLHGYPHDWHRFTVDDVRRIFADFHVDRLDADPQAPGVMVVARKPADWRAVDLNVINVAPADAINAPRL